MIENNPTISVITVVYNDFVNLEKTINSVIELKFYNIEYIIIDGGSTDGTTELIKKYESQISYWSSEPDKGIYDAMNKGAKFARGKYLLFLNSGDYLTTNFVKSMNDGFLANIINDDKQLYDVIYGDVMLNRDFNRIKYHKAKNIYRLYYQIPFCHQASLILRTEFTKREFDISYKIGADFKLFRQLYLDKKKFKYVSIPFVFYNLQGVSSNNPIQLLRDYKNIMRENKNNIYSYIAIFLTNIKILKHVIFTR